MAQASRIGPTTRVRSIANPVSCNMLAICAGAKKLNRAVCHQSDNDKRAHYPAGPQGAMQGHSFRHLMQVHSFGHVSFSDGGYQYSELTVSLRYDNHRGSELTVLSTVNNTEARKCRISNPSSFS